MPPPEGAENRALYKQAHWAITHGTVTQNNLKEAPPEAPPKSPRRGFRAGALLQKLKPPSLDKLKCRALSALLSRESAGAKEKVAKLRALFPEASPRELAYKLTEEKKKLAGLAGGLSGGMGFLGIPVDMAAMAWLQASLLAEVASVFEVNIKTPHAAQQALALLEEADGVPFLWRMLPKTLGGAAVLASKRLGALGKAVPVLSAPLSAYLSHRHLQAVGEAAIRCYDGFPRAHRKLREFIQPNP